MINYNQNLVQFLFWYKKIYFHENSIDILKLTSMSKLEHAQIVLTLKKYK